MFIYIVYIVNLWWCHTQSYSIHQQCSCKHTHTSCICTTSRQHQCTKTGKQLFVCAHIKIYCRSTSKKNPLLEEPGNARHSFLIPMHTQSARHSLGRRTPPRRPHHPSRCSSFLQKPPFSNPKTAPSSCCAQDHTTTTCCYLLLQSRLKSTFVFAPTESGSV